jgi:hypothetical protein
MQIYYVSLYSSDRLMISQIVRPELASVAKVVEELGRVFI